MRIVSALTAATFGVGWLFVLYGLTSGQGLVSMGPGEVILNYIVVIILSCSAFFFGAPIGGFALLGWVGGQAAFLTYDGMPKGRSPQMFQPTNFQEAAMYATLLVVGLNWPAILGAAGGFFMGLKARVKNSS